MHVRRIVSALALASAIALPAAHAEELAGSITSMRKQHAAAKTEELTFYRTAAQVRAAAGERLDTLPGNADYRVNRVSFPYAQPEVRGLIERIAAGYRSATGEQLVVTSLTRPTSLQPRNAHKLSVHPAGMAVDLRIPQTSSARKWLEAELLKLEGAGVLDVTRERRPPHYHVAVFPDAYRAYANKHPMPVAAVAKTAAPAVTAAPVVISAASVAPETDGAFGAWAIAAVAGMALAGGSMARRAVPVRPSRRRDD